MPPFPPCCGLIIVGSRRPIPLQGISVDVQVKGFVADVSATLKYKNKEEKAIEAVFVFPMDEDSAVYSFEATIEGKKIVADLQEKKQAQKTYNEAIHKGKQAFLLQEDESSADIFSCSVGNLPPGQDAEVSIKYMLELPMEADGAVRFVLPAVLNPRYTPEDHDLSITATRPVLPIGKISYTLSLTTHFQSAYGIAKIESNCDITPLEYTDSDKTGAKVSLAEGYKFEQDVELLAYYMDVNKPSVTVEAGLGCTDAVQVDKGSIMAEPVAMLNFYPSFPAGQEQSSRGEFIFLVDRSGSMDCLMNSEPNSRRIESAKETLVILLKSLPLGCYFNIFGFGSHFEAFFPESVEYTQQSMEEAVKKVNEMDASFGGTEILKPLKKIYQTAGRAEHPRQLFVFTDGEVGNTKKVINVVQENAREHRCFTFGIGEGASTSLIKGMARAGGGTFEFITGKDRMQPKVLRALKYSLQPAVMDISLTWTLPSGVEAIVLSKVPTAIFQGQRSIVYAQLKGKNEENEAEGEVCLQYKFQGEIVKNSLHFHLNVQNTERPTICRLAAKALISELEHGTEAKSEKVKKMILETSLQSGVVSSLTAFVAVNKDTKTRVTGPPVRRDVSAPSTLQKYRLMPQNTGTLQRCRMMPQNTGTLQRCRMMPQNTGMSHNFLMMTQNAASDEEEYFDDAYESPNASDEDRNHAAYEEDSASDEDCDYCAFEVPSAASSSYGPYNAPTVTSSSYGPYKTPRATPSPYGPCRPPTVPPRTYVPTSHTIMDIQAASSSYGLYNAPTVPPRTYVPTSHTCIDIQEKQSERTSQAKASQALVRLIALQNADGSWNLTPEVLEVLGISEADAKVGNPDQNMEVSVWVTVLAVIWLHTTSLDQREEWELLEGKAISWVRAKAGSSLGGLVGAGNKLLKSSLDPKVFGL